MSRALTGLDFVSQLSCVRCSASVELRADVYGCDSCGGNLRVDYDYPRIASRWPRSTLEGNEDRTIWRYLPLLPVTGPMEGPPVGWTPLIDAPRLAERIGVRRLLVKDDGRSPSASFKDRATATALQRARQTGHSFVIGASTGNAASSTAVLGAALGVRTRIFVPRTAPQAKVAQLLVFGAEVFAVEGTYDDAFDLSLAATARFGYYNRNTGFNPFTREGKKTVSFEICEQLGWKPPDLIVVPVGDGNIISGVGKGLDELQRLGWIEQVPRLLAVQAENSAAIVQALDGDGTIQPVAGTTVADSISVSLPRDGEAAVAAVRATDGFGITVSDEEILNAIPEVARGAGVFGEPAAVATYAGLKRAAGLGRLNPDWTVVMLITGNGLKDVQSALKVAGQPRVIRADVAELEKL